MISLTRVPWRASRKKSIGFAVTALLVVVDQLAGVSTVEGQSSTTANFSDPGPAVSQFVPNSAMPAQGFVQAPAATPAQPFVQAPMVDASAYQMVDPSYQAQPCNCPECQAAAAGTMMPAKPAAKKKGNPCARSHKGVFYANDFSYLDDPNYNGSCLGDAFKGIGPRGNIDFGGQIRFRYNSESGLGQQAGATRFQDTQNDFLLARLRLYADWQITDRVRLYTEGIYADVIAQNDEYIPRGPIDRNFGDFLNLFLDFKITDNSTVRVGRQELLFGAQRLVSPLDWANTRRTFDGASLIQKWDDVKVNWFYVQAVPVLFNDFDESDSDQELFGFYSSFATLPNSTLDLYALGFNDSRGFATDAATVTFGSRISGSKNDWHWDFEGGVQTGSFDTGGDIEAGFWTAGLGRSFNDLPWKPKVTFWYDFATGNRADGDTQRFNDLFPLGHKYLGFIDAVTRSNIKAPSIQLNLQPRDRLSLLIWYHNLNAAEEEDIVASLGGTPAQSLLVEDFGNEIDFVANFKMTARTNLIAGYSHFFAGDKIIDGEDADFFYLAWQTNF